MNAIKDAIKSGRTVVGTTVTPDVDVSILADAGYDFLLLDTQHSAWEIKQLRPSSRFEPKSPVGNSEICTQARCLLRSPFWRRATGSSSWLGGICFIASPRPARAMDDAAGQMMSSPGYLDQDLRRPTRCLRARHDHS